MIERHNFTARFTPQLCAVCGKPESTAVHLGMERRAIPTEDTTVPEEQARFERWATTERHPLNRFLDGNYASLGTRIAWKSWQASKDFK